MVWIIVGYLSFSGPTPIVGPLEAFASLDGCSSRVAELKKNMKPEVDRISCMKFTVKK